jgi:hypothetical protein
VSNFPAAIVWFAVKEKLKAAGLAFLIATGTALAVLFAITLLARFAAAHDCAPGNGNVLCAKGFVTVFFCGIVLAIVCWVAAFVIAVKKMLNPEKSASKK